MGYLRRGKWIMDEKFVGAGECLFAPFSNFFLFPLPSHTARSDPYTSNFFARYVMSLILQQFPAPSGVKTRGSYTCTKSGTVPALLHSRDLDQSFGPIKACQKQVKHVSIK